MQAEVALAMADGVARRLGADFGVATTGVAGPDPQDGQPPGTVFVAVHAPPGAGSWAGRVTRRWSGDRGQVRWASVVLALELLPSSSRRADAERPAEAAAGAAAEEVGAGRSLTRP